MAEEQKLVPVGGPPSPPYADAFVVHNSGVVMTVYLMRVPIAHSEQQRRAAEGQELELPVVSSATMTRDSAVMLADLIYDLAGKKRRVD